jgi:hypothetical protein
VANCADADGSTGIPNSANAGLQATLSGEEVELVAAGAVALTRDVLKSSKANRQRVERDLIRSPLGLGRHRQE